MNLSSFLRYAAFLLILAVVTGCGSQQGPPAKIAHMKMLLEFYSRHLGQNKGAPPADEAAFRAFIKKLSPYELRDKQIDPENLDPLFISPRDNHPYVILYKSRPGKSGKTVLLHEKTGVNGKRLVAYSSTDIEEVDEAKFKELVP